MKLYRFMGCVVIAYRDKEGRREVHMRKGTKRMDVGEATEQRVHREDWRNPWSRTLAPLPKELRPT